MTSNPSSAEWLMNEDHSAERVLISIPEKFLEQMAILPIAEHQSRSELGWPYGPISNKTETLSSLNKLATLSAPWKLKITILQRGITPVLSDTQRGLFLI